MQSKGSTAMTSSRLTRQSTLSYKLDPFSKPVVLVKNNVQTVVQKTAPVNIVATEKQAFDQINLDY